MKMYLEKLVRGRTDGQMDGRIVDLTGQIDVGGTEGQMDRLTDRQTDGQTDG